MKYDHILIRYGELGLKGKNMKSFLIKLQQNIRHALNDFPNTKVRRTQGRLFIELNGENPEPIIKKCKKVFGIYSLSLAIKTENTVGKIKEAAVSAMDQIDNIKTFKVAVRRANKAFPYKSPDLNQMIGGHVLRNLSHLSVDVHNPDIELTIEIRDQATYIMSERISGLGGLPVGTGGKTLLLLSGGIDSPVAGYQVLKRGLELEAIHFHSPPYTSERAKQKVLDLLKVLTQYGNSIKLHLVPFTDLQQHIFKHIPERYGMTVMRRIMLQISERVCNESNILAMTTGESIGQVASQTLASMNSINEVTTIPVIRPLVTMDKEEIVEISKQIKTYDISIRPYEDCCTVFVPKSPVTNPKREKVVAIESKVDFTKLINKAIDDIELVTISNEEKQNQIYSDLL